MSHNARRLYNLFLNGSGLSVYRILRAELNLNGIFGKAFFSVRFKRVKIELIAVAFLFFIFLFVI